MKIIDSHTHLGSYHFERHPSNFPSLEASVDFLKKRGTDYCITSSWQAVLCEEEKDLDEGNAETLAVHQKYPDFVYPGVVMDCRWPERSLYWLDVFYKEGFRWVGEMIPKVPEGEKTFASPAWIDLFQAACDKNMIVNLHNSESTAIVAKAFPKLQIVGSHLNPAVLPTLVNLPNVMLDFSGLHGGLCTHCLEKARKDFGASRLLYGTDYEGYDPLCFITRAKDTFLAEELPAIFHQNIEQLLKKHNSSTRNAI